MFKMKAEPLNNIDPESENVNFKKNYWSILIKKTGISPFLYF